MNTANARAYQHIPFLPDSDGYIVIFAEVFYRLLSARDESPPAIFDEYFVFYASFYKMLIDLITIFYPDFLMYQ